MSVFRPKRSKNDFLDQINGLKRVENLFGIFWQILAIMTAHNVMKMPSNAKMTFRRRKIKEDMGLNRIEKIKSKWFL